METMDSSLVLHSIAEPSDEFPLTFADSPGFRLSEVVESSNAGSMNMLLEDSELWELSLELGWLEDSLEDGISLLEDSEEGISLEEDSELGWLEDDSLEELEGSGSFALMLFLLGSAAPVGVPMLSGSPQM